MSKMNHELKNDPLMPMRHSAEHVLHKAMTDLFPGLKRAMGPATADGFYFDFDYEGKISEEDFPKIEKRMQEIMDADLPIIREEISPMKAKQLFKDNDYKLEWIHMAEIRNEPLTVYWTGHPTGKNKIAGKTEEPDVDLCTGPHVESTGDIGHFKLLSIAGAYWHGDEKNKMLTRIYGTSFPTKEELDAFLTKLDEAKLRDHRRIGKELDLFTFSDLVGKGFAMYTPKGTIIRNELKNALFEISKKYGVQEVTIPHLAKLELYKTSGHAAKFSDELFKVISHYDEEFVLKPVNCPHHTQIYASKARSYRELPIRYIESTQQHRDEKPGAIGGLYRTRSFTVDDGHTFCTVEQIKQEAINTIKIIEEFYTNLGMWGNHWVSLSFRDPAKPEKYIGDLKDWEFAQKTLQEISDELGLNAKVMEGEAALYGPKIDFMLKDASGSDRQLGTVQIDFAMPPRFGLTYIDKDGSEKNPVMLHRAILGSYERFIANLLEQTMGALPVWLSPVQVAIIPISDDQADFAYKLCEQLKAKNIRTEVDDRTERMQAKIRDAQMQKVPYMFVVGKREAEANTVSVRLRDGTDLGALKLDEAIGRVVEKYQTKSLEL